MKGVSTTRHPVTSALNRSRISLTGLDGQYRLCFICTWFDANGYTSSFGGVDLCEQFEADTSLLNSPHRVFFLILYNSVHKLNCLWWRGVFHICEGNVPPPIKGCIFSHKSKIYLVLYFFLFFFFSLPGALRAHMWIPPPPVSVTPVETKHLCPTLFFERRAFCVSH